MIMEINLFQFCCVWSRRGHEHLQRTNTFSIHTTVLHSKQMELSVRISHKKAYYKQNILFPFLNNFTLTIQGVPEKMKPIFIPYFSKSILPVKRFIYQFLGIFYPHLCKITTEFLLIYFEILRKKKRHHVFISHRNGVLTHLPCLLGLQLIK